MICLDKEKGNLYVSDKNGIIFTLSLQNHLVSRSDLTKMANKSIVV